MNIWITPKASSGLLFFLSASIPFTWQPLYVFCYRALVFYFLVFYIYMEYIWPYSLLSVFFFTQCNYFEIHQWCSVYQQYITFYCWWVFPSYGFTTVYSLSCWGTCVFFILGLWQIKLLWTCVYKSLFGRMPSFPLGKLPRSEMTISSGRCVFNILRIAMFNRSCWRRSYNNSSFEKTNQDSRLLSAILLIQLAPSDGASGVPLLRRQWPLFWKCMILLGIKTQRRN